ncbi:MAG: ATP-binding protein [Phycisphaerales bacterium]
MPTDAHEVHAVMHPAHNRGDVDAVERAILAALERFAYPDASKFAIRLALEEALTNAFQHGHRGLPDSETLTVTYEITQDEVKVSVHDRGPGFKPDAVPDPTTETNLELPSGRGLMLMRAFMTNVEHDLGGARMTMTYRRPTEA